MIGLKGTVEAGNEVKLLKDILRADLTKIIVPVIMVSVGFFFLALGFKEKSNRYYLYLASYLIVDPGYLFGRTYLKSFLYHNPYFWVEVRLYCLYALPTIFIPFISKFTGRFKKSYAALWLAHTILLAIIIVCNITGTRSVDQFYDLYDDLLLITMFLVGTFVTVSSWGNSELRILAVGFMSYMLTGTYDALVTTNVLPYQESGTAQYGSLLLILSIIAVHSKRYSDINSNLEKYSSELIYKNQELERLSRIKDEFLANTSHELRTPLNGIIGLSESILDGVGGPINNTIHRNLSMIVTSGKRLSSLVNDILDYSKLRHRELQLQLETINVSVIIDSVLFILQSLSESKKLSISSSVPHELNVVGDSNRVHQILHNIIGNAIKYTNDGGSITITATSDAEYAYITVSDTGIGIPSDKLDLIFQSFEQVDSSVTRAYGGTGLGLPITKSLVELHGGEITVQSEPGVGSSFTFNLPKSSSVATPPEIPMRQEVAVTVTNYQQNEITERITKPGDSEHTDTVRILVVDDDPVNIQVVTNHLMLRNWETLTAYSGLDALELVENEKVDLVLLDVMMPMMSGLEVCSRLREMYLPNDLPIILLTAKNSMDDFIAGFQVGANDYLTKPFSKQELIARVEAHVQVAKASAELRRLKEGVQVGTSFLRHAIKNDVGLIDIFSNKIRSYAVEHNIQPLIQDTTRILDKNAQLIGLMQRINTLTAEIVLFPQKRDIRQSIEVALARAKEKMETIGVTASFDFKEAYPLEFEYDPFHIEEVLLNILHNSIEAMQTCRIRKIYIDAQSQGNDFLISIRDTGDGIPEKDLANIFHLYYSTKKREGNFGLGLYYSSNVLSKHGGQISVDTDSTGTTVSLRLPMTRRD